MSDLPQQALDGSFNADYYSTAAQVIPIFFLLMIGQEYWKPFQTRSPSGLGLLNLSIVGMVVIGEVSAISALSTQEEPSHLAKFVIVMALVAPTIRVALALGADAWRDAEKAIPKSVKTGLWVLILGGGVALVITQTFTDPSDVMVGVLVVLFLIAFIIGSFMTKFAIDDGRGDD